MKMIKNKKMITRHGIAGAVRLVCIVVTSVTLSAAAYAAAAKTDAREDAPKKVPFDPVSKDIEGWTVHVDPQMLAGEHAEAGGRALTMLANHLEYFAEGTEAYFYRNDFYPFVRAELEQYDPMLHELLEDIWGPME